ncbi:MAG: electron transfer flavoprotein subunit beta/FixA family protein [Candidatus Bathyarchaeota archaeon]|nr:MAG: electron transfer flavoprotein subunit beta/FixA family protein [Candidatus Bathyarchaeota archaeon]
MNIIVCVKHVPETAEAEIKINPEGTAIEKTGLVFDINEWDDYALEEAVQIKEKFGGSVTAITVGPEDADSTLRKCLARGADNAIRLTDPKFNGSDSYAIAKILHKAIKDLPFDIVLTGALAGDDGYTAVGPILAEHLEVPHATMIKKIELSGDTARVNRELEGGLEEVVEIKLPAVLSIQTGINEPRYVSIMGIRKAMQKETKILGLADLGLSENEVGEAGSWITIEKVYVPPVEKQAEFLKGSAEDIATKIAELLKARGLV